MNLRFEEDLVESVVWLFARGRRPDVPPLQLSRFHREREKLYAILDPDERNTAFFKFHLEWFSEWGFQERLTQPLAEFPLLSRSLSLLAIRKSRDRKDEGAELYVNEAGVRSGVVALRPDRFEHEAELGAFLRHELTHLHDMVDPAFGYSPELPLTAVSPGQHNLARERYRLLWDVSIDGRLTRAGHQTIATPSQRQAELARAFPFWPEGKQRATFNLLWTTSTPTHGALANLVCDPRELGSGAGPKPGAPCPLCGFPTFDWAGEAQFDAALTAAICADFPHWTFTQGACRRCLEIYQVQNHPTASFNAGASACPHHSG